MILAPVYTSYSPSINAINAHPCLFSLISASTSSSISRKSAFGCPIRAFQGKLLALVYASHTLINALKAHPWFFSLLSPSTSISFGCPFSTLNTVWLKSWQEVVLYIISNCTVLKLKMNSIAQELANKCFLVTNLPGAVHIPCIKNMHAYFVYGFELRWNVGEFAAGLAPIHSG